MRQLIAIVTGIWPVSSVQAAPSGVGFAMKPTQPLKPQDVVKVEIEGLGYIENEVVVEPAKAGRFF